MHKVLIFNIVWDMTLYQVNASDVIILEGILVFHDSRVHNLMNMKIFVDTGDDDKMHCLFFIYINSSFLPLILILRC